MYAKPGSQNEIQGELSADLEKYRELGITYGLSDYEIDKCIHQVFASNGQHLHKKKTLLSKVWRLMKILTCFWVICIMAYVFATNHKPTTHFIVSTLQPYGYPVGRFIRIVSIQLTKRIDLSGFYGSDCIIDNPLFYESLLAPCDMCQDVTVVEVARSMNSIKDSLYTDAQPVVFNNAIPRTVGIDDLVNLYRKNREVFSKRHGLLSSNDARLNSLADVFEVHSEISLKKKKSLHIAWTSKQLASAQQIRKLFPRPGFVPKDAEVAVEKILFIDGLNSAPFSFPTTRFPQAWYVQASGSRVLYLYPAAHCFDQCKETNIVMEPRTILFYNDHLWNVDSVAAESSEPSVAFIGSFS